MTRFEKAHEEKNDMRHALLAFVFLTTAVMLSEPCLGQDVLAEHKVKGLKGLRTLSVVIRPNTPREIASLKEWGDMLEVGLHRVVPELTLSKATDAPAWLELSVVTTDAGGVLEISVYRWVKVLDSSEDIFSKVWWDSRFVFGGVSKKSLQESLDALLTSFAADFFRAKR